MTDKQINIVEILAEQCKNCTLYEGDTVSLNISIFDRPLKGVCFNNNIYFSVDELNYIMQKLISKEQECERLKNELIDVKWKIEAQDIELNDNVEQLDQLKAENEEWKKANDCILTTLNVIAEGNKKLRQTLTEIKEIAITGLEGFCPKCSRKECEDNNCIETAIRDILQKISECEGNDEN